MATTKLIGVTTSLLSFLLLFTACSDDDAGNSDEKFVGIYGVVTNKVDSTPVYPALVTIINENTQQIAVEPFMTDSAGNYKVSLPDGVYQVHVTAQGFTPLPVKGSQGIPLTIQGDTVLNNIALTPTNDSARGWVEGTLENFTDTLGALITLVPLGGLTHDMVSTVSTNSGTFVLFNLPAGEYQIVTAIAGYATHLDTLTIVADSGTIAHYQITPITGATVSGTVTFRATTGVIVDVSLIDTLTGLVIPGLTTHTDANGNYSIANVPDGFYLARASYAIDGRVIDPDWIVKFGEPTITVVNAADVTRDFSCTGAVSLSAPIVDSLLLTMDSVNTLTPTFSWTAYPSANEYVIEVINESGDVIWGGFNEDFTIKNVVIPSSLTSTTYNSDGAAEDLENGKTYRWKVYASKDDNSALGWRLISMSEEAQGVFKVVLPPDSIQ